MPSPKQRRNPELTPTERNVASIWAIPEDELPTGAAQLVLVALAHFGWDVYAYVPVASEQHVLWLGRAGRHSLQEWQEHFNELLVEMGYTAQEGGADE